MDWLATLRRSGGLHALARQIGASPADVTAAAAALMPVVLDGMRQFVAQHGGGEAGVRALLDVLAGLGDGNMAAEVMGPGPFTDDTGRKLLGAILPEGQAMAAELPAGDEQGALPDRALPDRALPGLAMLIGGYIAAQALGSGVERGSSLQNVATLLAEADVSDDATGWDDIG